MYRKLTLYTTLTILASVALGFSIYRHLHPGPIDWTEKKEVTIVLTKNGFMPKEVYLSRNATVTFSTELGNQFWPASDLHPFHTIYSAFDPKHPINATSTWNFTFNKDGHWSYHDHIGLATAVIIVVPPGEKGSPKYDTPAPCDEPEKSGRAACFKEHLTLAIEKKGLDGAFDELASMYSDYPEFRDNCHLFVHDLGLMAYKQYGDTLPKTSKVMYCGQGFYHGYMEGFLVKHKGNTDEANVFCSKEGSRLGGSHAVSGPQCVHGIGHGSMEYLLSTRPDLSNNGRNLEVLLSIGLNSCIQVTGDNGTFRCASGVFAVTKDWINIQNMQKDSVNLFSLKDPVTICRKLTLQWQQSACAWEMAKEALVLTHSDSALAFHAMISAASTWEKGIYLPTMITSAGFLIGELGVEKSDAYLTQQCASISDAALRVYCAQGIERGLIFNAKPGSEIPRSAAFCLYSGHTEAEKQGCAKTLVQSLVDIYGESIRTTSCAAVKSVTPLSETCMSPINLEN